MTEEHELKVARLEVRLGHLELQFKTVSEKLDLVLDKLNEAKGGWRVMMFFGGAAAGLGGVAAWIANHVVLK